MIGLPPWLHAHPWDLHWMFNSLLHIYFSIVIMTCNELPTALQEFTLPRTIGNELTLDTQIIAKGSSILAYRVSSYLPRYDTLHPCVIVTPIHDLPLPITIQYPLELETFTVIGLLQYALVPMKLHLYQCRVHGNHTIFVSLHGPQRSPNGRDTVPDFTTLVLGS